MRLTVDVNADLGSISPRITSRLNTPKSAFTTCYRAFYLQIMLTDKDRHYAKKRKRVWDSFGWVYRGINHLSKNHSLNCGCSMCRMKTYHNRLERKQERYSARRALKDELNAL